ncbi:hypothetical protein [Paenibacillus sp. BAC0078]
MIKFLGLGLAASLLFAPTTGLATVADSTSAQSSSVSEVSSASSYTFHNNIIEGPGTKILVGDGIYEAPKISLFSEAYKIVPVHHTGGAFNDGFTCTPTDGVNLNIWMRNNSGHDVQFQVKRNGSQFTDQTIAAGAQKTVSFKDLLGNGLDGSYTVYIQYIRILT